MPKPARRNLSQFSAFSGSALAMAFSLLAVIALLVWWQLLITRNLASQYTFLKTTLHNAHQADKAIIEFVQALDSRLAAVLFTDATGRVSSDAGRIISERLENRQRMVFYEQGFFSILLLSGHIFFLYIYFRERTRRKQTEQTILLATHELRQPLQSLSLALETVEPHARGKSLVAIQTGLGDIRKLGYQIRWLADTFSGRDRGQPVTSLEEPTEYIKNLVSNEFTPVDVKRVKYAGTLKTRTHLTIAEPRLRFLLRNLIENALKYATGAVNIDIQSDRRVMILLVENHAPQMGDEDFQKIGGLFYRSRTAEVQNNTGFGLGLFLCGRIAHQAGGSLQLEKNEDGRIRARLTLRKSHET
jgi:signal transduction histidine kinase